MGKLIVEGEKVYEIDEECLKQKNEGKACKENKAEEES